MDFRVIFLLLGVLLSVQAQAIVFDESGAFPPAKRSKCERVMVTPQQEDKVSELGIEVAELMGLFKLRTMEGAPALAASSAELDNVEFYLKEMKGLLDEARRNYSISASQVDLVTTWLSQKLQAHGAWIKGVLNTYAAPKRENFMKREIFAGDPDMAGWSAAEIRDYLSTPRDTVQQQQSRVQPLVQQQQSVRPFVAWPQGHNPYEWPPREKP